MIKFDRTKGRPEPIRLLNKVEEKENGEPLVDVRGVAPSLRILRPQVIPYVRETVAIMCERAAQSLPPSIHLGLIEGWRPIERQQRIYDRIFAFALEAFPTRDYRSLRRTVCRWVAPTDQKAPPGHCTGAAVDVFLVDDDNESLDVNSPFDRFQAAPTYAIGLTETAQKNRNILIEAMLGVGFSNCRDEWWHYSWGDAGYAVRMGQTECCYGLATLDRSLYDELEKLHIESENDRKNPFLAG